MPSDNNQHIERTTRFTHTHTRARTTHTRVHTHTHTCTHTGTHTYTHTHTCVIGLDFIAKCIHTYICDRVRFHCKVQNFSHFLCQHSTDPPIVSELGFFAFFKLEQVLAQLDRRNISDYSNSVFTNDRRSLIFLNTNKTVGLTSAFGYWSHYSPSENKFSKN